MMQFIKYPSADQWADILCRPSAGNEDIEFAVKGILDAVKVRGDDAVKDYCKQFDGLAMSSFEIAPAGWDTTALLDAQLRQAIDIAIRNIRLFHESQCDQPKMIETMPGVKCWRKSVGIEKVGLYIPGGTAPLFSTLLMLAVPAVLAGCAEVVVCTPPGSNGSIHPAVLYAAYKTKVTRLFCVGGAQAIAAMAYGTASIPRVHKIFGPGNRYVTCAKMLLAAQGHAIDMPAGPSELAVLADDSCVPQYVAADLLSQAEHGIDSQVLLVSTNEEIIRQVQECLVQQLGVLPRKEIAAGALGNSKAVLVADVATGIKLINDYAPEHLIIACRDAKWLAELVINAGSVFLGNFSPESAGDYASGTNHTLPTNGFAKAYSGVSLDSFLRKITFQELSSQGLAAIGSAVEHMAMAEGLAAHANAVSIRLNK